MKTPRVVDVFFNAIWIVVLLFTFVCVIAVIVAAVALSIFVTPVSLPDVTLSVLLPSICAVTPPKPVASVVYAILPDT